MNSRSPGFTSPSRRAPAHERRAAANLDQPLLEVALARAQLLDLRGAGLHERFVSMYARSGR